VLGIMTMIMMTRALGLLQQGEQEKRRRRSCTQGLELRGEQHGCGCQTRRHRLLEEAGQQHHRGCCRSSWAVRVVVVG